MAIVVADTDVLIDALHGRDPVADRVTIGIETGTLVTTSISVFELFSGAETDHARDQMNRLLAALPIVPFDEGAGRAAAETRQRLESQGASIGMADYLIAGICLARSATLLTRNVEHFSRIPHLRIDRLLGHPSNP